MPYGSIQAVKDNLPRIADSIKPDEQVSDRLDIKESTVTQFLTEFSIQVDAALSNYYSVPFATAPGVIDKVVSDLAAYKLARRFWTNISNEENHALNALRKDAKEILDAIVRGDYALPGYTRNKAQETSLEDIAMESEEYFNMEDEATWQDKI